MKIIFLFFSLINMNTNNSKFEDLIGKDILFASSVLDVEFNNDLTKTKSIYFAYFDSPKKYYNQEYNIISIELDNYNLITSLTVHFLGVIDNCFFDSFNKDYNTPYKTLVIDTTKVISEKKNGVQTIKKSEAKLIEGNFSENPLFIFWKNKEFQIKAFLRHKQNISEISFGNNLIPY